MSKVQESSDTHAFFAGIEPKKHTTSAGPCELPILYSDASLLTLLYAVDPARAQSERTLGIDPRAFEPLVVLGKAWMVLCAFEYRATSIGPYGELGLGLLVKRSGTSPSILALARDQRKVAEAGLFVTNLPVTTEGARAAGFELWGFPKYVNPIETSFRPERVRIALGGEIELTMKRGFHVKTRGLPLCLFSVSRKRRLLRTVVETESRVEWGGARTVDLRVTGDGPTAKTIQALGLHTRKPTLAFVTDHMRAILPAGEDVGALKWPAEREVMPAANGASASGG
jgi:hypothetical protein